MTKPTLKLIYARAANGVIGINGQLPWHLPEDLAHFKRQTLGCPVIMGRKTWESIPAKFRPLPGRVNVVVTRQSDWRAPGAIVAHSLANAVVQASASDAIWVIGGAELYRQALPLADEVVVTEIAADYAGDAYAPTLGSEWRERTREAHVAASGLRFDFVTYTRNLET